MSVVLVVVIVLVVVAVVAAPVGRRGRGAARAGEVGDEPVTLLDAVVDLEAARDAKYREIRDAELDHQTGKLTDEDYAEIDATLRNEAIGILRRLDRARRAASRAAVPDGGETAPGQLPSSP